MAALESFEFERRYSRSYPIAGRCDLRLVSPKNEPFIALLPKIRVYSPPVSNHWCIFRSLFPSESSGEALPQQEDCKNNSGDYLED